MILVTMGDADTAYAVLLAFEIGYIRQHQVDAEHLFLGEAHAHIHQNYILAVLNGGHILTNLVQATHRDEPYELGSGLRIYILYICFLCQKILQITGVQCLVSKVMRSHPPPETGGRQPVLLWHVTHWEAARRPRVE